MKKCYDCTHVEMCGWRKEVKEQGCEFFGYGMVWIPVEEGLPDVRGQIVMVTLKGDLVSRDFLRADGEPEWYGWGDEVIAWMPLPKPYKGGEDND